MHAETGLNGKARGPPDDAARCDCLDPSAHQRVGCIWELMWADLCPATKLAAPRTRL